MSDLLQLNISEGFDRFIVDVYDTDGEWFVQTVGDDFGQTLRHAIYAYDPVLAAAAWPDNFEWSEEHKLKEEK